MASRPMWSGVISFGLVQIPVGLHSAEGSTDELSFTLLDAKDHAPVGYKHVNKITGEEVPKERRVKGYEVARDEYVVLSDQDFKAANVKKTETIDIHSFVDAAEIPVLRFDRPYWLAPLNKKGQKGAKPYALLRDALQMTGKVAIATVVLRSRQQLCAVYPHEGALALQMLRYDDELRTPAELGVEEELHDVKLKPAEIAMAAQLVEGMEAPFDTHALKDTYKEDLLAIIEEKKEHPEHVPHVPKKKEPAGGDVVDLMALLQRSVSEKTQEKTQKAAKTTKKKKKAG